MDELQALHAGAVRPPEGKSAAPEGADGEIRGGSRGSSIRMHDMDPSKCPLQQAQYNTHRMLLRILGARCKSPNKRILSHKDTPQRTEYESTETTLRTRRLL